MRLKAAKDIEPLGARVEDIQFFFEELETEVAIAKSKGESMVVFYAWPIRKVFKKIRPNGLFGKREIQIMDERVQKIMSEAGYTVRPCFDSDYIKVSWED